MQETRPDPEWITDIFEANVRPVDTVKYNILGNTIVLEACRLHSVGRYVFASSVYVYSKSGGFYRCQLCGSARRENGEKARLPAGI